MVTTEIDLRVAEFLAARAPGDASPDLARLAGDLNALWWRDVERLLSRVARDTPDRVAFSPDERLLLDLGLLDWRLLPGGDRHRPALLRELAAPGRPHVHYFSEWIARRFRQSLLYGEMSPPGGDVPTSTVIIRDLRGRLYLRLTPLFKNLPGFDQKAVDLFLSGRVDATLDAMTRKLAAAPDERLEEQRRQLTDIRLRLLVRARERARAPEDISLFDALRDLDRQVARERSSVRVDVPVAAARTLSPEEREKFVLEEARFVKNVLWLGVTNSGVTRAASVLVSEQPRLTKAELDGVFARVREADPALPLDSTVLIAPYQGSGFYEWDRDTLFLPLVPVRSPDHAVLGALASYRILLDTLQDNGRLKMEYEKAFGGVEFHAAFARDYRAWVLEVCRGAKAALDPERFAFFRDRLGPGPATLFAPPSWASSGSREDEEKLRCCRALAAKSEAGYEEHFRLAVFANGAGQTAQAIDHLQAALRFNPADGRALLALGVLTARSGDAETSRRYLADCASHAPHSLWAVLAGDEARRP
ncbi:MAG TPA: hypothetical protein VF950_16840 [Planctomycetota bacterium]